MQLKDLRDKHIVVTGGAGFLGSHLCERLLKLRAYVICVDNFITGAERNIISFYKNYRFQFIQHNVTTELYLPGPIFAVLHFASPASPADYITFPIQTLKVGALGTHKMLGLAKAKTARFLLASTSEVYGDPLIHPQPESYWGNVNPVGPRGVYDEAKRYAEALTMAYHRVHKLETRIARIFNTYGPRMRPNDGRAIPSFISQALANKPLTIFGNGRQTRSFCYIEDEVEGLLRLLVSDATGPINIGNPQEMSVEECARLIIRLCKSKSRIIYKKLPVDDPKVRQPDISFARNLLKWAPSVSLEVGLRKTIPGFKSPNNKRENKTMMQKIAVKNMKDENENPSGGDVRATGIAIDWQNGPLGRGLMRQEPNGAFVEGVIQAVIQRLEFFQESKFKCRENALAITKLEEALHWLNWRTTKREQRDVEGTHSV